MDFTKLISSRESVRDFDPDKPVDPSVLKRILEAGRLAPSATNRQPWRFLVVSSPELLAQVRLCYHRPWFSDAPHVLIVKGNLNDAWVRKPDGYNSLETDLAIAMDHMILAAENEGVGACWVAAFDEVRLRKILSLRAEEKVFTIAPLGYPKAGYTKKGPDGKVRKPLDEIVEFL